MMKHTRKTLRRFAASFLAVMLLAALAIVPAGAAGVTTGSSDASITSITVSKDVTTDGNTYAPNTSFTIAVEEGQGGTFNDGTTVQTALPGVEGGLTGTSLTFAPVVEDENAPEATYNQTGALTVNIEAFANSTPGIYHYVVKETAGTYDGIEYDGSVYDVYLYLMRTEENVPYIGYAVCVKHNTGSVGTKSELTFTNNYNSHDVLVTKQVEGTFANMDETFTFTVKVDGHDGEYYKVEYSEDGTVYTTALKSGDTLTLDGIMDDDYIHIYGLSKNDTYTVTETDSKGYTVTDTKDNANDKIVSGKATQDGESYIVTNTKNASTPTGIITTFAPYALMVVVAAAACFFFLRRRNTAED